MKKCLNCKKEIPENQNYCSVQCSAPHASKKAKISFKKKRKIKKEEYEINPIKCAHCNTPLPYDKRKNKFCSHSCAAMVNNKGRRRHGNKPNNCLNCGKKTKTSLNKYCSKSCCSQHKYDLFIEKWLNGEENGYRGGVNTEEALRKPVRRWMLENRGEKCEKCGWNEINPVTGKVPVQINHVDGNCRNCHPDNLEVICPNCHSLTPNFGSLNRGSGRNGRYK